MNQVICGNERREGEEKRGQTDKENQEREKKQESTWVKMARVFYSRNEKPGAGGGGEGKVDPLSWRGSG